MMLSELQIKDIVDINSGVRVGRIIDVKIDEVGKIVFFVVEPKRSMRSFMNSGKETTVLFDQIKKIGSDVILVNL